MKSTRSLVLNHHYSKAGSDDVRTSGGGMKFANITGHVVGRTSGGSGSADNIEGSLDLYSSGVGIRIR